MARKRKKAPPMVGGVPAQLADPQLGFWRDVEAVRDLAIACGLDPDASTRTRQSIWEWQRIQDRFNSFRLQWAKAHGMGRDDSGTSVDWHALQAAGVDISGRPRALARQRSDSDLQIKEYNPS